MNNYQAANGHERVFFEPRERKAVFRAIEKLSNTHPTFVSIRASLQGGKESLTPKQVNALNYSLRAVGLPSVQGIVEALPPVQDVSFRGSAERAVRAVMLAMDTGSYGNWTYRAEEEDVPEGMAVLVVNSTPPIFMGFEHAYDIDTAQAALEGACAFL